MTIRPFICLHHTVRIRTVATNSHTANVSPWSHKLLYAQSAIQATQQQ